MLYPKYPPVDAHRLIYKGYVEEGPGQYPIAKTKDWVEDIGTMQEKIGWAAWRGFLFSSAFALVDIRYVYCRIFVH